jgi:O-antigen/teichoic acid export membrane protein
VGGGVGADLESEPRDSRDTLVADHLRGSSLLLAGRVASLLVAFLTQVLIVRHLAKSDYGAFAYALSAVLLLQSVLPLGMDRADSRFLALYDERDDGARLLGVIVLEAATILAVGGAAVAVALTFRGAFETSDGRGFELLLAMFALAPLQALDALVINVFAVFAKPWSVFVRRYVLEPGLRLLVAVVMVLGDHGVIFLAIGFVVVSLIGTALYAAMLARLLKRVGVLVRGALRSMVLPVRDVLGFSFPLLLTNFVAVAGTELAAVILGHYHPDADVAAFRAVQPLAALNLVVMFSFGTLYTPAAARLCARDDRPGLRHIYWQSACWIAILTFPVLAVTTALAAPFTVATFGERYSDSALYLALLSIGYYVNAALGFNGVTVLMMGRLRYITIGNVVVLIWMVAADLVLIPPWGAIGAVVAVLSTLLVHNVVKHCGLGFGAGVGLVDRDHLIVMAYIVTLLLVLNGLAFVVDPSLPVGLAVVAATTVVLLRRIASQLDLAETFPELARVPLLRWIIAPRG